MKFIHLVLDECTKGKSKLKEEELRIRKLELELNQKKWEIEEQKRKQRLLLDAEDAFLAALKPNSYLLSIVIFHKQRHLDQSLPNATMRIWATRKCGHTYTLGRSHPALSASR